jgi:endonuclease III
MVEARRVAATKKPTVKQASMHDGPRRAKAAPRVRAARRAAILAVFERLKQIHPDAHCELVHGSPFQLLVATVLSAQATDRMVNAVTPALFERFPTAEALAKAPLDQVEGLVGRLGFFRQKAKNIVSLSASLVEKHGGEVPRSMEALTSLAGVGRKTANVVLGTCFGAGEGVVVDTHVQRISQRLGWTRHTTPETIEADLTAVFPAEDRDLVAHVLIFHGRRVCFAQSPACSTCGVRDACPSADHAEKVGRKPPRARPRARSLISSWRDR